jgi:predicted DNA-binding transcriptional regulator YafY
LLAQLFGLIRSHTVIQLRYHVFGRNEERTIAVSPYLLKEYNRRWFLLAAPTDSEKVLTFALDRIVTVDEAAGLPYHPAPADFTERYEDIIGVTYYEDRPVERITFWVSDLSKDYVITKPLHDSMRLLRGAEGEALQRRYPNLPPDGIFCTIDCIENYELIRELAMFGAELIVLSPASIAGKVLRAAQDMVEAYRKVL